MKRLLEYFDFKESFELDLTETNPENSDLKDSIYKVDSLANGDQLRIDFGQIIQDYKLDFYDKNLKQAQGILKIYLSLFKINLDRNFI